MSVNLNTNHSNSGVYTSNNINSTNTNENNENSLEFDEVLEQEKQNQSLVQNQTQNNSELPYLSLKPQDMAQKDFQTALKALDKLVDYNTGEKIEFDSLSEEQQKDLLKYLAMDFNLAQSFYEDKLEYSKVNIIREDKYVWASFEYQNSKGEAVDVCKDIFNLEDCYLGAPPLGDKDAQRDLRDLAQDYVNGNTDNYFGFLKRTRGENEPEGAWNSKDLEQMEQEIRQAKEDDKIIDKVLGKGVDGLVYISYANGSGLLIGRAASETKYSIKPRASDIIYTKMLDDLLNNFFNNKTQNPTYAQINEIKNSNLKQEDTMLKQALNLN